MRPRHREGRDPHTASSLGRKTGDRRRSLTTDALPSATHTALQVWGGKAGQTPPPSECFWMGSAPGHWVRVRVRIKVRVRVRVRVRTRARVLDVAVHHHPAHEGRDEADGVVQRAVERQGVAPV